MKKGKTASIAIIVGFIITVCLIIVMLHRTSDYFIKDDYALISIHVLDEERSVDGASCQLTGHFSMNIEEGKLLYFYPSNLEVKFWLNGKLIYEFANKDDSISSTPGRTIAMLDLGNVKTSDTIRFELNNPWYSYTYNDVFEEFFGSFVIGDGQSIYQYLIHDKWIGIVVSLLMMFMGVFYFIYTCMYYIGHFKESEINFAYSLISFSGGAYILIHSLGNLLPLILTNPIWCSLLEVSCMYITVAAIVTYLYVCANGNKAKKMQYILVMLILVNLIIIYVREMMGFSDMYSSKEIMVLVLYTLLAISVLVGVIELFNKDSFQTRRFFISLIPSLVMIVITSSVKYYGRVDVHDLNYIGIFISGLIISIGIASDARMDQLNLAFMTKQMITKKEELEQAIQYISESKQRTAKLISEKEMLEAQNQVDIMTGLFNKTAMTRLVTNYLLNNNTEKVALIFIDLDHFKSLNDTLGHMKGDDAIRDTAKKLKVSFRRYDIVSRFGGDEFCVFLRSIEEKDLINKLELLRERLTAVYSDGSETVMITGSVGCAYCHAEKVDYDTMLKLADSAVYEAKSNGRNRYVIKYYE